MKKIFVFLIMIVMLFSLSACNKAIVDWNLKFTYILIEEGEGLPVLHEIKSWNDSESDSATVTTKCCGNYIWTSANNATLYKEFPNYLIENVDYVKCSHMGENA